VDSIYRILKTKIILKITTRKRKIFFVVRHDFEKNLQKIRISSCQGIPECNIAQRSKCLQSRILHKNSFRLTLWLFKYKLQQYDS